MICSKFGRSIGWNISVVEILVLLIELAGAILNSVRTV
jgi:hypothetical protein